MISSIRSSKFLWLGLAAAALVLTGCSEGAGSQEELVEVLAQDDSFSRVEAECIADAIFDEYGESDDLSKISAQSWEQLQGEDGVPGFDEFLTESVNSCIAVGPSADG